MNLNPHLPDCGHEVDETTQQTGSVVSVTPTITKSSQNIGAEAHLFPGGELPPFTNLGAAVDKDEADGQHAV